MYVCTYIHVKKKRPTPAQRARGRLGVEDALAVRVYTLYEGSALPIHDEVDMYELYYSHGTTVHT